VGGAVAGDRDRGRRAGADPAAAAVLTWLDAAGRALGGTATVAGREPLAGGYVSDAVERIDLDVDGRPVPVVLKAASAVEVAAMRAVAVVGGVSGALAVGPGWVVLPFVDAPLLACGAPVPDAVWDTLARVHTHWYRKRPRGIPVVDGPWWAALCDRTLVAVRGGAARTGDQAFSDAERALLAWRADERILRALATLPRTLCHGDAHRGNILGQMLIDWGNARVAPAGLDLAVLRGQGAEVPPRYSDHAPPWEQHWADVQVNIQYLGFAADHLGPARVAEMVENAARALPRLGAG
jgi:Phosphotransferase enzyme family